MADDAERRVRDEIVSVLEEFQVPYTLTNVKRHAAVMFDVAGKHLTMTYAGGDPRAHLNARSDIRRTLLNAGAVVPEKPIKPEPIINNHHALVEELLAEAEQRAEPEPVIEVIEEMVTPETTPVAEETPLRLNGDDMDYIVHQPRLLVPNKCLVIEIHEDLLVAAGSVVVVPLDKPGLIPMSREMFDGMFTVTTVHAQMPEPITPPLPFPPPIPPQPDQEEEDELPPAAQEENVFVPFHVTRVPEGVSGLKPPKPPPVSKSPYVKPPRANNIIHTPYRDTAPRSIDGVSPQLGRILAAMMYVSDLKHRSDLEPSMLDTFLFPHDKKQFAARMSQAIRLGVVERGLPLPNRPAGHHVKITANGRKMVRKMRVWPWLYDGQSVPTWIQQA